LPTGPDDAVDGAGVPLGVVFDALDVAAGAAELLAATATGAVLGGFWTRPSVRAS
jgi:hypothetical protein